MYKLKFILSIICVSCMLFTDCSDKRGEQNLPFLNTDLSVDERVDDLVNRLTLDEKIAQMMNDAPGIPRLQIPPYNWWSEGLHGVARAGLATVFPQAIGLSATWDDELLYRISTAIADEARAKHQKFIANDKRFIYQGLTLWSPNINLFRDPRWGRGQETYGEDPLLTGTLATQFIKGLQGDDPTYLKTIATVKHFAVHSGPEPQRHEFDAVTSEEDLDNTYLPHFEMAIRLGKPYSVMCAYNRYNGKPCCSNTELLNILRNKWKFDGFVVSDCEAITDIYKYHKVAEGPAEAASMAVKAGTDLECGQVFNNLKEAIMKKIITEAELDVAVKRLFKARFKLGMFDPTEKVKYAQTPYTVVDNKEHKDLALEAARKSIVLLKNERDILPLKKDYGTIAVIGPNANQWLMLLGNYNGVPSETITPLQGIKDIVSDKTKILFAQGSELADGMPMFFPIPSNALFTSQKVPGVYAEFFDNITLSGKPIFSEVTPALDANWYDKAPRAGMDDDKFSVRWTTELSPQMSGVYQLGFISTCNTKLYVDDSLVAKTIYHFRDEYGDPRLRKTVPMKLESGKTYKVVVEAIETFADAQVQLVWAAPKPNLKKNALEAAQKADVIIMCMGLTPNMEGEEMDVQIDGFKGGDRTKIDLPLVQHQLIKEINALGKPVILVLLNGSAIAVNWEDEHVAAIIEAWYPGQAAGRAIADVLFGDYNPGGRLSVTFYRSTEELPPFHQYEITNQTYRYFKGKPLYPFGYGLSYTSFQYSNLKVSTASQDSVQITAVVTNTGHRPGDEVVQVYTSIKNNTNKKSPLRSLATFKRINLEKGESREVNVKIKRPNLPCELSIGGGQPDTERISTSNILKTTL
jgi:beta-glucosidase